MLVLCKPRCSGLSVVGMDKFTLEHRVFLYDTYVKCNSARKCQRQFVRKFPGVRVPHRNTIQNLVNKVRTTGVITDLKPERTRRVLTEEKLDDIATLLEHSPHKTFKHVAEETGVSKSTVRIAAQLLKLRSCEPAVVHSLQRHEPDPRPRARPVVQNPTERARALPPSSDHNQSLPHQLPVRK
jgi:transposase